MPFTWPASSGQQAAPPNAGGAAHPPSHLRRKTDPALSLVPARLGYPTGMEPRIQYATTRDGVSIAYWAMGEGPTVVVPPPASPWSHLQLEWQVPEWRHWYEHMLESVRVVRYDGRGTGLSDRTALTTADDPGLSLLDLEAVVDRAGADEFALFGCFWAGPAAIAYAAQHPDRVSHLVLWCSFARVQDARKNSTLADALERMIETDYENFTQILAHNLFGWEEGNAARGLARFFQQALSAEEARRYWNLNDKLDLDAQLPKLTMPALVMHRREFSGLGLDVAQRLASRMPNARLQIFEGKSLSPFTGDSADIIAAVGEFIGVDMSQPRATTHTHDDEQVRPAATPIGFRTIMFTDMAGSTEMTRRLGDDRAQTLVRRHNRIVGDAIEAHGGQQIKHTGDGIMASFPTATRAVECAIAIQRAVLSHNAQRSDEEFDVRIGVNAGEPVEEGGDLFGTAVQLASRVCARADPGEILTTDVVRQLVAGRGFLFADRGDAELRGFEDPVRVYEVRWRESA